MARSPKKEKFDKDLIRELADLLDETSLSEIEIEIEQSGLRVRVSRNTSGMVSAPSQQHAGTAPDAQGATDGGVPVGAVTSPMVGTAYMASAPEAAPFVKVGDTVSQGQTLLIVEAMKTMNQIPSPRAGKVLRIMVENGQPVEFGEPLLVLE
jgi:acetyl-CoA carboxylase biotin carboxyl carrier protein